MIKGNYFSAFNTNIHSNIFNFTSFLLSSRFTFYLTGSQFFGNTTSESDFDYFCVYDIDTEKLFKEVGFEVVTNTETISNYSDFTLLRLYEKKLHDGNTVHIQLLPAETDVITKINAQIFIKSNRLIRQGMTKREKSSIWSTVIKLLTTEIGQLAINRKIEL